MFEFIIAVIEIATDVMIAVEAVETVIDAIDEFFD
jgi:hypothetical protein